MEERLCKIAVSKKHYSMGYVYCHRNDVNYHELMHIADERMDEEKNERKARE